MLRSCGSRRTLSQSPRSCVASTTSRMPRPGKMVSHQSPTISIDRPSASIEPQAGSGGGTPTPRKLSEASAMITTPIVRLASTIVEFNTLGNMWRKITRVREPPAISASLTNSRSRRLSTSPRMKQRLTAAGHTRVKLKPHQKYWAEVVDIYRAGSPDAAKELVRLATEAEDERVRSVCAGMVMDRAWGRPKEYDPNAEEAKKPPPFDPSLYTTEELRRMQEVMMMIARRQGLLPPEEDEAV